MRTPSLGTNALLSFSILIFAQYGTTARSHTFGKHQMFAHRSSASFDTNANTVNGSENKETTADSAVSLQDGTSLENRDTHNLSRRSITGIETVDDLQQENKDLLEKRSSDFGYGSRIGEGSGQAQASGNKNILYGVYGHGKRSVNKRTFSDFGYGSRLQAGENIASSLNKEGLYGVYGLGKRSGEKRTFSDFGYGSRLQAGEQVAQSLQNKDLYGIAGPGKRTVDFGYGSRLEAGENLAKSLQNRDLYGIVGPGKRAIDFGYGSRLEAGENLAKSLQNRGISGSGKRTVDFGYGSRLQAGKNLASSWDDGLYGLYGPGKRSSDFGYGSRLQADENIANDWDREGLYGIYGPGKRSAMSEDALQHMVETEEDTMHDSISSDENEKRMSTDYGYGSRIRAAENVAKNNDGLFGVFGPGKRSTEYVPGGIQDDISYAMDAQDGIQGSMNHVIDTRDGTRLGADSGYGSRVRAGSQVADDIVAINALYGLYGPGKR